MTCIIGYVDKGKVYMGSDSAGVGGWTLTRVAQPKVFQVGDFLFGYTTSFRMGYLINFAFTPPEIGGEDLVKYLNTSFIDAIRKVLKDGGFASKSNEVENGGTFLVGHSSGRLFTVQDDYAVIESNLNFASVGCGSQLALGAMSALQSYSGTPFWRIKKSLEIVENLSSGVCGPFHIITFKEDK